MIRFREFLAVNCPFEINYHCQKCTVALWDDLSFWKQTRPDTTSFFYDKRNDCHFESKQRISNLFLSKRASSSYRSESHQSFEESIINHLEETAHPSFRRENHRHFEKTANQSFRRERASIISKWQPVIISKRRARDNSGNESFINLWGLSFRNERACN